MNSSRQERFDDIELSQIETYITSYPERSFVQKIKANNENVLRSLRTHILLGEPTGSFAQRLLENNFSRAVSRADDRMRNCFVELATYLQNAPMSAWGSKEQVSSWRDEGGLASMSSDVGSAIETMKRKGL